NGEPGARATGAEPRRGLEARSPPQPGEKDDQRDRGEPGHGVAEEPERLALLAFEVQNNRPSQHEGPDDRGRHDEQQQQGQRPPEAGPLAEDALAVEEDPRDARRVHDHQYRVSEGVEGFSQDVSPIYRLAVEPAARVARWTRTRTSPAVASSRSI